MIPSPIVLTSRPPCVAIGPRNNAKWTLRSSSASVAPRRDANAVESTKSVNNTDTPTVEPIRRDPPPATLPRSSPPFLSHQRPPPQMKREPGVDAQAESIRSSHHKTINASRTPCSPPPPRTWGRRTHPAKRAHRDRASQPASEHTDRRPSPVQRPLPRSPRCRRSGAVVDRDYGAPGAG